VTTSGVTGDDGGVSWQLMLPPVPAAERRSEVEYKVRLAGTRGFVRVEEEQEVDFHRRTHAIVTTDKPLYQPGQTLHIRMLAYDPVSRRPRSIEPIAVNVQDEGSKTVFNRDLTSDRFGVASADWTIPAMAPLGTYSIQVAANDGDRIGQVEVRVSRYELPSDFRVQPLFLCVF
jgi:uncharacterized protein YfaS (alpha-2-macroglobulin family)